ncbi:leukocyte surface antigen CD53-like [Alosa sapidissima]|uniref:leukocyte surface antigen CD53-like n=1 Tax=Alosa sapidissima TaxID=34773 RepID=UPI001C082920|nr:leukocyte surface antigen CD53-like [Alosa sapidissima]
MSCLKCLKYTMCVANFLFFVCGAVILGFGIFMMTQTKFSSLLPSLPFMSITNILIIAGIVITCVSFLGFLGAYKENRCLLITFFILLFVVMLVELAGACILLVYEKDIGEKITNDLNKSLEEARQSHKSSVNGTVRVVRDDWDLFQKTFKCCGVKSWKDWKGETPSSCCEQTSSCNATGPYWEKGCHTMMETWFEDNLLNTGIGVIVICSIEVLGMCFSMTLFCHISRSGLGYKI